MQATDLAPTVLRIWDLSFISIVPSPPPVAMPLHLSKAYVAKHLQMLVNDGLISTQTVPPPPHPPSSSSSSSCSSSS